MIIESVGIENFRCFGGMEYIYFSDGLNVLVGPNDSGKSAIIDAICFALGTTDQSWQRPGLTDFHNEDMNLVIRVILKFTSLSMDEKAAFVEYLSTDQEKRDEILYINWTCKALPTYKSLRTKREFSTGINGDGPRLSVEAAEMLRTTYLRPLRDSYADMQSGRNSRLPQILQNIPGIGDGKSKYEEGDDLSDLSLAGIVDLSNQLLARHPKLKDAHESIENTLNSKMLIRGDNIDTSLGVAGVDDADDKRLLALLSKLDLVAHRNGSAGKIGLGTSNLISMACEMLLDREDGSSFLMIEEPEAHIHAQRQLRLIKSLQEDAISGNKQIIVTTHSPIMASEAKLDNIILINDAKSYPLRRGMTMLESEDYDFLEMYLDATKANLFFAKAVLIVEGPSEELLIPTIAALIGKDLTTYGVSIVNVRGTGMRRFARIFQRKSSGDNNEVIDIDVACVTDRDIIPDSALEFCFDGRYKNGNLPNISKRKWRIESEFSEDDLNQNMEEKRSKADGQKVKTFISDYWTFEYDMARAGLLDELVEAIVTVDYVPKNRESRKSKIKAKIDNIDSQDKKAAYAYNLILSKGLSKAMVAQQMAKILREKYTDRPDELREKLPPYIVKSIDYVTDAESEFQN